MARTKYVSPSLTQAVVGAIEASLADLHVGLPAKVISFDPLTQSCDVQPLLQNQIIDLDGNELTFDWKVISDVPVLYPAGGGWSLTFPLAPGDTVYLAFAEKSIDDWLVNGDPILPRIKRRLDLSDAVAVACLRPRSKPLAGLDGSSMRLGREDGSVVLNMTATSITVTAPSVTIDGHTSIALGQTADSPVVRGTELLTWLTTHTHNIITPAPGSPTTPPTVPPLPTMLSTVTKVK